MKFWLTSLIFISVISLARLNQANAQLDPASGLLLNGDSKSSHVENGLDSGRYKVRTRPETKKTKVTTIEKVEEDEEEQTVVTKTPLAVTAPATVTVSEPVTAPATTAATNSVVGPSEASTPSVETKTQVTNVEVKSSDSETIIQTPKKLSPIDQKKNNIIEINIAPVFIYNHSSSDISSRNYSTSEPAYSLDVAAWIEPNFGLRAQIVNSLASSVNDSYDKTRNTNLTQQWISAGLRYRNFLFDQKNSSSITLGLDYEDYQFQVDPDSQIRNRLETSGIDLSLVAEIPHSSKYSWELGVSFMPSAKHQETLTSASLQSGDSPKADVIGISIGGRAYIDSSNQMFWRISERIEKDQFSGDSSKADPTTGQTLTNVSVTNSFTMIQIGYSWGN